MTLPESRQGLRIRVRSLYVETLVPMSCVCRKFVKGLVKGLSRSGADAEMGVVVRGAWQDYMLRNAATRLAAAAARLPPVGPALVSAGESSSNRFASLYRGSCCRCRFALNASGWSPRSPLVTVAQPLGHCCSEKAGADGRQDPGRVATRKGFNLLFCLARKRSETMKAEGVSLSFVRKA
jgi:hypothetical protein